MSYQGNHYLVTFLVEGATNSVDVYAKDDTDAKKKVLMLYPSATNLQVSSVA